MLRILQNQSIRTPVGNLYKTFNTLPLPLMHEYRILNFVHAFINNRDKSPDAFTSYFVQNRYIHCYDREEKVTNILLACNHQLAKDLLLVRVVVYGTNYEMILN